MSLKAFGRATLSDKHQSTTTVAPKSIVKRVIKKVAKVIRKKK